MRTPTKTLTLSALAVSAVFASAFFLKIPTPVGYIHPGDGVCLLSSALLGPFGTFAAMLGAFFADWAGGYAIYAPVTALLRLGGLFFLLTKTARGRLLCAVSLEAFTVLGYFLYEGVLYGVSVASLCIIPNAIQGLCGVLLFWFFIRRQ